jgi:hypothetical protein
MLKKDLIHSTIYKSIEEKLTKIENKLRKNSLNTEKNQHHLHLIDRFKKKKFLQKYKV